MPSDTKTRSPFRLPLLLLVFGLVMLAGCNWFQPGGETLPGTNGRPKDVVAVFFSKYQGNQSVVEAVQRKLPPEQQETPLRYAVSELLAGPMAEEKQQGFYTEIPQGTQLLGVKAEKDTVIIDLSREFTVGGGSNSMEQRFEELKQTALAAESQRQIQVAVEGETLELLGGEGLEVQEALQRKQQ